MLLNSQDIIQIENLEQIIAGLVEKLGDNKIMIRQLAIQGLQGIERQLQSCTLLYKLTPYLDNPKWHIREEILKFIIITFLGYKDILGNDPSGEINYEVILNGIAKLFHDDKPKVVQIAYEACATIAHIGNKSKILFILHDLLDNETYKGVRDRIEAECIPIINSEGALDFPYIANELTTQNSFFTGAAPPQISNNQINSGQINVSFKKIYMQSRFTSAGPSKHFQEENIFNPHSAALKRPQTDNVGVIKENIIF